MTDQECGIFAQRVMYQVDRFAASLFGLPEPKTVEERLSLHKQPQHAPKDQTGSSG